MVTNFEFYDRVTFNGIWGHELNIIVSLGSLKISKIYKCECWKIEIPILYNQGYFLFPLQSN
jgi:hypothetical protein